MPSIADVYTTVFPETSKIAPLVTAAFKEVDAEAREAGRRWGREIQQGLADVDVVLKADTSKLKAEIDDAARDRDATVEVDADTAKAEAQIDVAARDRHSKIEVGVDGSRLASAAASTGAQVGSSMGGSMRTELIAAGVGALAAIASSASGLAGLIPAALGGAGLGIGTLVVGLDGVKDAWDAVGKAAKDSGSDQEAKAKSVAAATKTLRDAVQDEARAQKDVANARKDARQQLEDLNLELHGGALDEADAILQAQKAREDLASGMFETSTDYQIAQLRVQQADQRVAEAHERNIDLGEKANDARAKGVEGADNVVAANERLADTQERVADAQANLNDVQSKVSSSAQDAADAMAALSPNAQAFMDTLIGMKPAFQDFKFGIQDALFAGLGPQFQQLATTFMPMLQQVMTQMATVMNQTFGQIATLLQSPAMVTSIQNIFNNLGAAFQNFMPAIAPMVEAFTKLTEVGASFLPELGSAAVQAAQGFNQFIQTAAASGDLQQWIQLGINTFSIFGDVLKVLGQAFIDLAPIGPPLLNALKVTLEALEPSIGPLAAAFGAFITAITPFLGLLGQLVSQVIVAIAPAFIQWFNAMGPVIQQVSNALLPVIQQLAPHLGDLAMVLSNAMVKGIHDILPVLIPFVQQAGNLLIAVAPLLPKLVELAISAIPVVQQAIVTLLPFMTQWMKYLTDLANIIIPPLSKAIEFLAGTFSTQFELIKTAVTEMWKIVGPILETMKTLVEAIAGPLSSIFGSADSAALAELNKARAEHGLPPLGPGGQAPVGGSAVPRTPGQSSSITPIGPPFTGLPPTAGLGGVGTAGVMPALVMPGAPAWGGSADWDKIAGAEASGNWQANTGNGFFGGLQFQQSTWDAYKPAGAPDRADLATPAQQKAAAENVLKAQGPGAWPATSAAHPEWFKPPTGTQTAAPAAPPISAYTPSAAVPSSGYAMPYGLPPGSNSGGYGGGGTQFPDWVNQVAAAFGIKPSTYPGHQESDRNEPGYAPNPQHLNRAIDWTGPTENLQKFSDYLSTIPQDLEQVIWQNPNTGSSTEIAGGRPQPGYFSGDLAGHQDHVHTRQSEAIPLPGMPTGQPTDPMYIALSPNIPANQQKTAKGDDSGAGQLGQDFLGGIGEIFGIDGSVFKDPTSFGLFKILKGVMGLKPKEGAGSGDPLGGGGGGGGLGGILSSFIPKPFGDLKIGSPQDAPGQFIPQGPGGSGGTSGIPTLPSPFAPPNDPSRVAGPGNGPTTNINMQGSNFGYSKTEVGDQIQQGGIQAIRPALRALP